MKQERSTVVAGVSLAAVCCLDQALTLGRYLELAGIERAVWRGQLLAVSEIPRALGQVLGKKISRLGVLAKELFIVLDSVSGSPGDSELARVADAMRRATEFGAAGLDLFVFRKRDEEACGQSFIEPGLVCSACGKACHLPPSSTLRLRNKAALCSVCGGKGQIKGEACRDCCATGLAEQSRLINLFGLDLWEWSCLEFGSFLNIVREQRAAVSSGQRAALEWLERTAVVFCEAGFVHHQLGHRACWLSDGEKLRFLAAYIKVHHLFGIRADVDAGFEILTSEDRENFSGLFKAGFGVAPQAQPEPAASPPLLSLPLSRAKRQHIEIGNLDLACLKEDKVYLPVSALVCLSGPSGSGKTLFLREVLARLKLPPGRRPHFSLDQGVAALFDKVFFSAPDYRLLYPGQNLADYSGIAGQMISLLVAQPESRQAGIERKDFSSRRSRFRCRKCRGFGCKVCAGTGLAGRILDVKYRGCSFPQMLHLTAEKFMAATAGNEQIRQAAAVLGELGLGALPLGTPLADLSPANSQSLRFFEMLDALSVRKAGRKAAARGSMFLLDYPFIALDSRRAEQLRGIMREAVALGHSVICADNGPELASLADYGIRFEIVYNPGGNGGRRSRLIGGEKTWPD